MHGRKTDADRIAAEMEQLRLRVDALHDAVSDTERTAAVAAIQRDFSVGLAASSDLAHGLDLSLRAAIETSGMDAGGIYLVDEASSALELVNHLGLSEQFVASTRTFAAHSPNTQLVSKGKATYVKHAEFVNEPDDARVAEGLRALAVLPIAYQGRVIGCMNLASHTIDDIPETARIVLEGVVAQMGSAISRMRTQDRLRDEEQRFRNVVESSPMGIHMYELTADGRLVFSGANPAADTTLGVDNSLFVGKTIQEAFPPLAETEVPDRYRDAAANGTPWQTEQIAYEDDRIAGAYQVFAFQTKPGAMAAMFLDISERKRTEEEILYKNALLGAQFETSLDGMLVIGMRGRVATHNGRFRELWSLPGESLEGATRASVFARLCTQLKDPAAFDAYAARLVDDPSQQATEQLTLSDDRTIECYSTPLIDATGKFHGRVWYFRDLTERMLLEQRTLQSQKLEAIGRLAGGIAHDFNNLLTGILGYADLLQLGEPPDSRVYESANVIIQAATRASELTRQLLGFARRGKLRKLSVDLHRIVRETIAILGRTVDKRIAISLGFNAESAVVTGDPSQLEQVLMNLAVNARDAMKDGGELLFETESILLDDDFCAANEGTSPGRYLLLTVSDTGYGMEEQTRLKAFEPFFTTKPQGEGTGMGLAMVYGIIKNHGGHVSVYSEVDRGTTFRIYLPAADEGTAGRESVRRGRVVQGTGNVLIVDDEHTVRTTASSMLTSLGYTTVQAANGQEAVDYYRDHGAEVDLVLLDITMPVMDGRQCFAQLKGMNADVKVVLATGHALDGAAQRLLDAGALRFVQKPFTLSALSEAIAKAMA